MFIRFDRHLLPALLLVGVTALLVAVPTASAKSWTWKKTATLSHNNGSADAISCPSMALCVIVASDKVYVTKSASKAKRWAATKLVPDRTELGANILTDVSCPSATLCVAGDNQSTVLTSSNPAGGESAWNRSKPPSGTYVGVTALSCASVTLCGILDVGGLALTSTAPAAYGTWMPMEISKRINASLYELACVPKLCAGVEADGKVYSTSNAAAGGTATWKTVSISSNRKPLNTIACAAPTTCIAGGYSTGLRVTTNGAGAKRAWKSIALKGASIIDHTYCRTRSMCFAMAGTTIYASGAPMKAKSWVASKPVGRTILSDMSCPTARLCVAINVGGEVFVGRR